MAQIPTFEQFFRDQYGSLVALGAALTGDRATGEDLAQDALRITHQQWDSVSDYERPGAFTRRTMVNRASNERRRRGREGRALRRLASLRGRDRVRSAPLPLDPLWAEVATLPPNQRAAVALRYVDDLATADIADALGCAEATVRVHLHRAHRTLAERLGDTYEPDDDIEDES